jgi:hypothetical protein
MADSFHPEDEDMVLWSVVVAGSTQPHIPDDRIPRGHRRENLKS